MMILSTIIKMLKTLIKFIILSFQSDSGGWEKSLGLQPLGSFFIWSSLLKANEFKLCSQFVQGCILLMQPFVFVLFYRLESVNFQGLKNLLSNKIAIFNKVLHFEIMIFCG